MSEDYSPFVDGHRRELIQRVALVMPLADHLREQRMLTNEAYAEIRAGRIPQEQMRILYRSLDSGGTAVQNVFYHILRRENPHLVEELEEEHMDVDRGSQVPGGVTQHEAETHLGWGTSPRQGTNTNHSHTHTNSQFRIPDSPDTHVSVKWAKPETPWETDATTSRTRKPLTPKARTSRFSGHVMQKPYRLRRHTDTVFRPVVIIDKSQRPKSYPNTMEVESCVEDKKILQEKWNKISRKWQRTLHHLLEDPKLQSIGNGKLFMVKKREYKIGDGADGTVVYLGMKADGTEVAIKRMISDRNEELQNEMSLLRDPRLESRHIVKYVDLIEDGEFNYLVLQLCENNLEVYMTELREMGEMERMEVLKKVAREVLLGLEVLHKAGVIHRDIKPRNVLIDVEGNAKLADFGISRKLDSGASTRHTSRAGTQNWEATEILADGNWDEGKCRYKRSTDIQVAGMLVHYILSDGHHPFGIGLQVQTNIRNGEYSLQIQDVEAKNLIEWMITNDPEKRPTISEVMAHPYFWENDRRDVFLRRVGDENAVQNYKRPNEQLHNAVVKSSQGTSFTGWKDKICLQIPEDCRLKIDSKLPDDLLGLLRYLRNFLVHRKEDFTQQMNNMFKKLFPDFFICANKLAREMGWDT